MIDTWTKVLIASVIAPALIGLNALVDGYVMMKLWEWFVSPTFSLPEISMTLGLGFSLIASHLTHQSRIDPKDAELKDHLMNIAGTLVFRPGILLLVGWLAKTWFVVGRVL